MNNQSHIRNFAIIAHIDHGKSTLADRLMEMTGTVAHRDMQAQLLDSNPIERERGITIKLAPVRMKYKITNLNPPTGGQIPNNIKIQNSKNQKDFLEPDVCDLEFSNSEYILNLIDTPGHVDFGYEVSRSLAACEGALLVVDATQGVQAQTLANLTQARKHGLTIIPLINKIDMPHARISETRAELRELGFTDEEMIEISAKTGQHVDSVLEAIITRIPPPKGNANDPTRALVFSSQYNAHKGVVVFVRVVDGSVPFTSQSKFMFLAGNSIITPIEIGYFNPKMIPSKGLLTGEVGYIATGLKDIKLAKIGDTITLCDVNGEKPTHVQPLAGYREPKPMVFVGLYPLSNDEFTDAREAMEKLQLSDSAFTFRPVSSLALGNGFHCGFLGLLHAEIVQERLNREYDLSLLATAPSVEYLIKQKRKTGKEMPDGYIHIESASEFPDPSFIEEVKEPIMQVTLYSPKTYVGPIMQLCQEKRGTYVDLVYRADQAEFTYLIPLSDMIVDFFDRLKSVTEGYASLDYEFYDYQTVDAVKVDILVNHERVDALSFLIVKDQARKRGKELVERLAQVLPRQQFNIPVQAAIGGDIVARDDIKPFRKDVIQKLYGGDRSRKDKLLKKQKKGKEKMKQIGSVEIPQTAFFDVLKRRS